jgi:dihydroneopterin triphosphate diphosphatase
MIKQISTTVQVHIAAFFEEFHDYKYLLLKRSRNEKVYPGIWQVITGTIETGELAVRTALRETEEEINCKPLKMWTLPYVTNYFNPKSDTINFAPVFGILINSEDLIVLSDEHEKYEWLHLDLALEKLALPSHREATKIFHEHILTAQDQSVFELKAIDF